MATDASSARTKQRLMVALRTVVSLLLIGLVVSRVGSEELLDVLRRGGERWWFLALAVLVPPLLGYMIGLTRLHTLLATQDLRIGSGVLMRGMLLGTFFNQLLPTSIGGDAYQVWYLGRYTKRLAAVLSAIFLGRILGVVAMCILALAGGLFHPSWLRDIPALALGIPLFIGFPAAVAVGLWWLRPPAGDPRPGWSGLRRKWHKLATVFSRYRSHPGTVLKATGISVVLQTEIVFQYWLIALALGVSLPFERCLVAVPIVTMASMLPVSLNGLGIREWVMIWICAPLGIASADAAMITWMFVLSGVAWGVVGALIFWRSPYPSRAPGHFAPAPEG